MMLIMQGIGYVRGDKQVTKNGYYRVNVSCKANKDEWKYITIIYGEMFNKYPMQYVKEGDIIYFEIKDIKIDVKEDRNFISGFAINMSLATSSATKTNHTTQKEDSFIDEVAVPPYEGDYVPF